MVNILQIVTKEGRSPTTQRGRNQGPWMQPMESSRCEADAQLLWKEPGSSIAMASGKNTKKPKMAMASQNLKRMPRIDRIAGLCKIFVAMAASLQAFGRAISGSGSSS